MNNSQLLNVNSRKFVAIIPAAGSSERFLNSVSSTRGCLNSSSKNFGSKIPKQYQMICDRPLIFHTVSAFLRIRWIDHIIVVAPSESLSKMEKILTQLSRQQQKRFDCIAGDCSRHRSIRKALDFLTNQSTIAQPELIIVHDGARPFIDKELLHRLVTIGDEFGSAGVHLKRDKHWASEMPQVFRLNLLLEAYSKCTEHELDHNTECLDLVQRYTNTDARLIHIDPNLYFKVTYRKDLYSADNILKERRHILLHCDFNEKKMNVNFRFIKQLKDNLCDNFSSVNYFNNSDISEKHQTNAAIHSTGFVHILLHYCYSWNEIVVRSNEDNLSSYDNLIYIVIICNENYATSNKSEEPLICSNGITLEDSAYPQLIQWTKRRATAIKNFYFILANSNNLEQESQRIRNTICYMCKELPPELSGQAFFM
ncbi:hypothetical protein BLOT_011803 [Blomia tropicalis]|nr:hypothetical protein BLOT_011803 [Blomia tropicalis]